MRQIKTMIVRIQRVHESNVRAHDVFAVLTEKRRHKAKTVKRHIRCVERPEHWKVGQIAEQTDLTEDWKALLDQIGPALALALGVGLVEEISAASVEDVVADCSAQSLVLGAELVQKAGVER